MEAKKNKYNVYGGGGVTFIKVNLLGVEEEKKCDTKHILLVGIEILPLPLIADEVKVVKKVFLIGRSVRQVAN